MDAVLTLVLLAWSLCGFVWVMRADDDEVVPWWLIALSGPLVWGAAIVVFGSRVTTKKRD